MSLARGAAADSWGCATATARVGLGDLVPRGWAGRFENVGHLADLGVFDGPAGADTCWSNTSPLLRWRERPLFEHRSLPRRSPLRRALRGRVSPPIVNLMFLRTTEPQPLSIGD